MYIKKRTQKTLKHKKSDRNRVWAEFPDLLSCLISSSPPPPPFFQIKYLKYSPFFSLRDVCVRVCACDRMGSDEFQLCLSRYLWCVKDAKLFAATEKVPQRPKVFVHKCAWICEGLGGFFALGCLQLRLELSLSFWIPSNLYVVNVTFFLPDKLERN